MKVTREVILDLLPVYLAGEASPDTKVLVEEFLQQDTELAARVRLQAINALDAAAPPALPPELELRSLRRTRKLLAWQRWLFGFGIGFTALSLSNQFSYSDGRFQQFHFLLRDYPGQLGTCLALGVICWIAYYLIRRRLRTGA